MQSSMYKQMFVWYTKLYNMKSGNFNLNGGKQCRR
nr:MAG TPA: hypothetical protein [Bacteriophage sp.]